MLVPGIVAVAPWLLLFVKEWADAAKIYSEYRSLTNALLFAIVVIFGSVFGGVGTILEIQWDREREEEFQVRKHWHAYLGRSVEVEPVGYRYVSRLATTLYFELSMMLAAPSFFFGAAALMWWSANPIGRLLSAGLCAFASVGSVYFWWEARHTHKVLCETRRQLNS